MRESSAFKGEQGMKTAILALATSAAALSASAAGAATIYTNRGTFDAAGSGATYFQNFDSVTTFQDTPFTFGPITATGAIRAQPAGTAGTNGNVNGTGWVQFRLDVPATGTLTSTTAFRLLGFDYRAYQGDEGELIRYLTNTGDTGTFSLPTTATAGFIGFGFNAAVTSVTFSAVTGGSDASSYFGIDNLRGYAGANAVVPEPASWAMMIGGVGLVGGAMRRRRNVTTRVRFA